jgi:hypothetical protein
MITCQWKRVHGKRSIRLGTRLRTGPDAGFAMALIVQSPRVLRGFATAKESETEGRSGTALGHPYAKKVTGQKPCHAQKYQQSSKFFAAEWSRIDSPDFGLEILDQGVQPVGIAACYQSVTHETSH